MGCDERLRTVKQWKVESGKWKVLNASQLKKFNTLNREHYDWSAGASPAGRGLPMTALDFYEHKQIPPVRTKPRNYKTKPPAESRTLKRKSKSGKWKAENVPIRKKFNFLNLEHYDWSAGASPAGPGLPLTAVDFYERFKYPPFAPNPAITKRSSPPNQGR